MLSNMIAMSVATDSWQLPLYGNGYKMLDSLQALQPMIDKLANHSLLDDDDRSAIKGMSYRLESVKSARYLVRNSMVSQYCGVILKGFAFGSSITKEGNRQIVSIYMRGDMIDLANIITPVAEYNVQALTDVELAHILRNDLIDLVEQRPSLFYAFWRDTLADASIAREWMIGLGRRSALQRLSHFIHDMGRRQKNAEIGDGVSLLWPFTQEQIGDVVGLTAVHVNRTMQVLREQQVLSTGKSIVKILNPKVLRQIIERP